MKRILRRFLLPLLCVLLCTSAAAMKTQSPGRLTNGIYYGTGMGRNALIAVRLEIRNGRIADAQIDRAEETPGIYERALVLLEQMIGMDSTEELSALDTISGATRSSQGILDAAARAMEQATPAELPAWMHSAEGACPGSAFADLPHPGNWAHQAIDWALCIGLSNGVSGTAFAPEQICTRAQIVTLLWRAAGSPMIASAVEVPFVDVPKDAYYSRAVQWAISKGITRGVDATHFDPDDGCTRAQALTFLYRAAGEPKCAAQTIRFTDLAAGAYYAQAVAWAVDSGVTNGLSPTRFGPDELCTRAQIVTFCFRSASDIISE